MCVNDTRAGALDPDPNAALACAQVLGALPMADEKEDDRRRAPRMDLNLIVRVQSGEENGAPPWTEVTTTADASPDGVAVVVEHPLSLGQKVRLQLLPPLPKSLGPVNLEGPSGEVLGVVRNAREEAGAQRVGVMFVDAPPEAAPPESGSGAERRQAERFPVHPTFIVLLIDEFGVVLKHALTVAEDISRGGAQLASQTPFSKGDVVIVQESAGSFEGRAEVTHTSVDEAGLRRVHVRFLDGRSPDAVVPQAG